MNELNKCVGGGDCLKTQTSSVKIDTKLVKMALNMDLKDKKMTKKVVFRQSEGGILTILVEEKFGFMEGTVPPVIME